MVGKISSSLLPKPIELIPGDKDDPTTPPTDDLTFGAEILRINPDLGLTAGPGELVVSPLSATSP